MRVLVVVNEFPVPSETFVVTHVEGLLARGHDVVVVPIVPSKPDREFSDRVRALVTRTAPEPSTYPTGTGGKIALLARLLVTSGPKVWTFALTRKDVRPSGVAWRLLFAARLARVGPVDVIHAHFGLDGLTANEMRRRGVVSAPLVVTFHGRDALVHGARTPGLYDPLGDAQRFTVTTEFMRGVVEGLGVDATRIRLWRQGVDIDAFTPDPKADSDGSRVVSVGRMVPFKGHDLALRVIAAARAELPRLRYTIVGDGALRPDLERLARELGVDDITIFAGVQTHEQTLAALRSADVFLHMGRVAEDGSVEAQGVAPAEASSCGLPVIATRVGGLPEVVIDGETGVLVDALDVDAAAAALVRLAGDALLRQRLGRAGRAFVETTYGRDASITAIEDVYREVLKTDATPAR